MICWSEGKNKKFALERGITFEEISEIILNEKHLDILENPSRIDQKIFVISLKNYIYAVPFIIDENENIVLKTAYPSRKLFKKYGGKNEKSET
jgi:uncharacterized DUF497 family protein